MVRHFIQNERYYYLKNTSPPPAPRTLPRFVLVSRIGGLPEGGTTNLTIRVYVHNLPWILTNEVRTAVISHAVGHFERAF